MSGKTRTRSSKGIQFNQSSKGIASPLQQVSNVNTTLVTTQMLSNTLQKQSHGQVIHNCYII
jgi:hypothetical protein